MSETGAVDHPWPIARRNTTADLLSAKKRREKWAMLTCYDALSAEIFESQSIRALLVGDSAAMVVYGRVDTLSITSEELMPIVRAVVAATKRAFVVADMPFGSYQVSPGIAVSSAVPFLKDGGAQAVKLEGGSAVCPQIAAIVAAGIPVMAHIGLTPQSINALGGYHVQGKGSRAGRAMLEDALRVQDSGAFSLVLEAVPAELGAEISQTLEIPVIGIGAGPGCDAQILVWQDAMGLTSRTPKFVRRFADMRTVLAGATRQFVADVESGAFPDRGTSY